MASGITFTGRQGNVGGFSRLSAAMIDAAKPRIEAAAEATIEQAKLNILDNIATTYGQRQGKQRSEPLSDPARYPGRVEPTPKGVVIRFSIDGSEAFKAKALSLNGGARAHEIAPRPGGALANKADQFFSKKPVTWTTSSGKFGSKFFTRGIDDALRDFRTKL